MAMNFITNIMNSALTRGLMAGSGTRGTGDLLHGDSMNRDMEAFGKKIQEFSQGEAQKSILESAMNQASNQRVKVNLKQASEVGNMTFG